MRVHASCTARDEAGVLILGEPGAGKSDLVLRLIDRGHMLVADDQVEIEEGVATAPASGAGLIEIHGFGIVRRPYRPCAALRLAVRLASPPRLPEPQRLESFNLPLIELEGRRQAAAAIVDLALDCVLGRAVCLAGALA